MVAEPTEQMTTRDDVWTMLKYEPTPAQLQILNCTHRQIQILGGFRGGKSRTCSMCAVILTIKFIAKYGTKAAGQVAWVVGADYERTRAEWEHPDGSLLTEFQKLGMYKWHSASIEKSRMEIKVPGADKPFIIRNKSAMDPSSLGMESPVWILLVEAAHVTNDVYERLYSRTSEARKRWGAPFGCLIMSGTSEGAEGWYPALYTSWQSVEVQGLLDAQSFSLPSWSNTHIYPGGYDDPEIQHLKDTLPKAVFDERHGGIPVAPAGMVHPGFDQNVHIKACEYDIDLPVFLGIDVGYSGEPSNYVVAVWQYQEEQWRCIDTVWGSKYTDRNFSGQTIVNKCKKRSWWKAKAKGLLTAFIDPSANRHADANKPAVEIWKKVGGITPLSKKFPLKAQIDKWDQMLGMNPITKEPYVVLDPSNDLGLSEFGARGNPITGKLMAYKWPTDSDGMVYGKVPHPRYNDFIQASVYFFLSYLGAVKTELRTRRKARSTTIEERLRLKRGTNSPTIEELTRGMTRIG